MLLLSSTLVVLILFSNVIATDSIALATTTSITTRQAPERRSHVARIARLCLVQLSHRVTCERNLVTTDNDIRQF